MINVLININHLIFQHILMYNNQPFKMLYLILILKFKN